MQPSLRKNHQRSQMETNNPMLAVMKDGGHDSPNIEISTHSVAFDDEENLSQRPVSQLKRTLTFTDGFAVVVGIMIGSGIFASPGLALQRAGSPGLVLIAWSCAGLLVCFHIYFTIMVIF